MITLRVYGDSLPLPSSDVSYHRTYPGLISLDTGMLLFNRARGGSTITDTLEIMRADAGYPVEGPVLIHLGIVDCAPRPIPHSLRRAIARLPRPVRTRIVAFLHRHRSRILRLVRFRHTSLKAFERALRSMVALQEDATFIAIANPGSEMERQSPGVTASVAKYNDVLSAYAPRLIVPNGPLADDGHHLTALGHEHLAHQLLGLLRPATRSGDDPDVA